MNEFGQIAVLVDSNDDYFYYYQLDEERVVRITEDGVARINAYWDMDILTEDMLYLADDRDFTIEYLDDGVLTYLLENAEETEQTSKMINKLQEYQRRTAKMTELENLKEENRKLRTLVEALQNQSIEDALSGFTLKEVLENYSVEEVINYYANEDYYTILDCLSGTDIKHYVENNFDAEDWVTVNTPEVDWK